MAFMDYLFAPNTAGGQHLVNMTLAVYNAAGEQDYHERPE